MNDGNIHYSYTDPMFDVRRLSTTKDKFLDKFVFTGESINDTYINIFTGDGD